MTGVAMATQTLEMIDVDYVRSLVLERTGIQISDDKRYLVTARLQPVWRAHGLDDIGALVMRMRAEPHGTLVDEVVDAMTTNETLFFRDGHPFRFLQAEALPRIMANRPTKQLRLWSAACSTGQEALSLAMITDPANATSDGWDVRIVGTDISSRAIHRARQAMYNSLDVQRGLTDDELARWFHQEAGGWRATPRLRDRMEFVRANLVKGPLPDGPFDVVLLRNVLIYFDEATRAAVLGRVHDRIAPDGVLLLGGPEAATRMPEGMFHLEMHGRTVWSRPVGRVR